MMILYDIKQCISVPSYLVPVVGLEVTEFFKSVAQRLTPAGLIGQV